MPKGRPDRGQAHATTKEMNRQRMPEYMGSDRRQVQTAQGYAMPQDVMDGRVSQRSGRCPAAKKQLSA